VRRRAQFWVLTVAVALAVFGHWFFQKERMATPLPIKEQKSAGLTSTPLPTAAPSTPTPETSAAANLATEDRQKLAKVQGVFSAPIEFFGKVVDNTGRTIPGANVFYSAADQYFGPSTKYNTVSDVNGLFSLRGAKGAGLYVEVSKEGYERIADKSYRTFGFGMQSGDAPPSQYNPAVFILRKKNIADRLVQVDRDIAVLTDGTPLEVSLVTGKPVGPGQGDLKVECWTNSVNPNPNANERYDWHFRLSVPGGGIVERTNGELSFEAPEVGYEPSIEYQMSQRAERWRRDHDGQYWVKLGNGTFARMRFRITTGGSHFVSITSYLNPSGSRNLEFDPDKALK
jgi:Carboxypeptidase regulatory-like domain